MRPEDRNRRAGFTLIEILVSVIILGTVGMGLAGLSLTAARRSATSGAVAYRAAALNAEVSRITAIPAGGLSDGTTTRTVTSQPFPYTMTTLAATSGNVQTVTITITPTGQRAIGGRSRTITRSTSSGSNPFAP